MLRKLSDNDEAFILDMLQTFKRTAIPAIARMEEYLVLKKTEAVGREAHKMIPGVSFLGVKELEKVLVAIEENGKSNLDSENMHMLVSQTKKLVHELIAEFEKDFTL